MVTTQRNDKKRCKICHKKGHGEKDCWSAGESSSSRSNGSRRPNGSQRKRGTRGKGKQHVVAASVENAVAEIVGAHDAAKDIIEEAKSIRDDASSSRETPDLRAEFERYYEEKRCREEHAEAETKDSSITANLEAKMHVIQTAERFNINNGPGGLTNVRNYCDVLMEGVTDIVKWGLVFNLLHYMFPNRLTLSILIYMQNQLWSVSYYQFVFGFYLAILVLKSLGTSTVHFVAWYGDIPKGDRRPDSLSLGALKHDDPMLGYVSYAHWPYSALFRNNRLISFELLTHLTTLANMDPRLSDKDVWERLTQCARTCHSVNIPRELSLLGFSVPSDTVEVAFFMFKALRSRAPVSPFCPPQGV